MVGSTISHYEIQQKLGEGGMGVVYKAWDTRLERFIALKILPAEKISDSDRRRRFVREAKSASALNHPNIVTIHDIDGIDEFYFIAMEYIEGNSLDRLIPRKGMRVADALRYAVQIADALGCAHQAGIVHRDLKPANVMVTERGLIKVVDFGLAKLIERSNSTDFTSMHTAETSSGSVTEKGYIVGTLAYMSPEQAEDKPLDGRSDVFSMGCLLYEMLTGKRAFHGDSKLRTLTAILTSEPTRISELVENMPPELERLVSRCLRKDRERRFQHMDDLKVALEELKDESDSGRLLIRQEHQTRRRHPAVLTLIAAISIAIVAAGLWFFLWGRVKSPHPPLSHPLSVTSYRGAEEYATLSPEGKQVAFSGNVEAENNFDIYVKFIGSDPPLRLTRDPDPDTTPVWSPDGRWIAFTRSGTPSKLLLISPLGGSERVVAEADELRPRTWSTDSQNILATVGTGPPGEADLVAISITSGERKQLIKNVESAAMSHDGHKVAFVRRVSDAPRLYVAPVSVHLELGEPHWLEWAKGEQFGGCAWTGGDYDLVCSVRQALPNPPSLWRIDTEKPSAPELLPFTEGAWDPVIPASADRLVFDIAKSEFDVWEAKNPLLTRTSSAPVRFASWTKADSVPQYSPDGSKISFLSSRSGKPQVWIGVADGSNLQILTSLSGVNHDVPRWSHDSKSLTFVREHEIYTIDVADGIPKPVSSGGAGKASDPATLKTANGSTLLPITPAAQRFGKCRQAVDVLFSLRRTAVGVR